MTAYEEHLVNNGWSPEEAAVMYQRFSDPTFGRDPEMMREYQPGFLSIPRSAQIREARPVTLAPAYTQRLMQASPAPVRTSPIIASTPTPVVRTRNIRGTAKKPARVIAPAFTPKAPVQAIPQEIAQATESGTPLTNSYFTLGGVQPEMTTMSGLPLQPRPDPYALAAALFANESQANTKTPSSSPDNQVTLPRETTARIDRNNVMGTGVQAGSTPTETQTEASIQAAPSIIEDENIAIPDYEFPAQTVGSTKTESTPQTINIKPPSVDLSWTDVNNRYGTDIDSWNEAAQELDRGNISLDDFAIDIHNPDQTTYSLPEATFGDLVDTAGHYLGSGLNLLGSGNLARDIAMGIPIKGTQLAKALGRDQLVPWLGRMSRPAAKVVKSEKALVDKIVRESAAHPYTSVAQNAVRGVRSGDYSALRWGLKHNPKLGQAYNWSAGKVQSLQKTVNQVKTSAQKAVNDIKKYTSELPKKFDKWSKPVNAPKDKTIKQQVVDKSQQVLDKTSKKLEQVAKKIDDVLMF